MRALLLTHHHIRTVTEGRLARVQLFKEREAVVYLARVVCRMFVGSLKGGASCVMRNSCRNIVYKEFSFLQPSRPCNSNLDLPSLEKKKNDVTVSTLTQLNKK